MNQFYKKNLLWALALGSVAATESMRAANFTFTVHARMNEALRDFGQRVIEAAHEKFGESEVKKELEKQKEVPPVPEPEKAVFMCRKSLRQFGYLLDEDTEKIDLEVGSNEAEEKEKKSGSALLSTEKPYRYKTLYNAYGTMKRDSLSNREYCEFRLVADPSKSSGYKKGSNLRYVSNIIKPFGLLIGLSGVVLYGASSYNSNINYDHYSGAVYSGLPIWFVGCGFYYAAQMVRDSLIKTFAKNDWVQYKDTIVNYFGVRSRQKKLFHKEISSSFLTGEYKKVVQMVEGKEAIEKAESDPELIKVVCDSSSSIYRHLTVKEGFKSASSLRL